LKIFLKAILKPLPASPKGEEKIEKSLLTSLKREERIKNPPQPSLKGGSKK